jgi:hypothetical protein
MRRYFIIIFLVASAGCVTLAGSGLKTSMSADPQSIFASGETRLYVDLQNIDDYQYYNINANIFDPGLLKIKEGSKCAATAPVLRPNETLSFECILKAPSITYPAKTDVNMKAAFQGVLSSPAKFTFMSEKWYNLERAAGRASRNYQTYTFRDRNVELDVSFNDQLPFVIATDKKYYIYFTIRNIGDGFITSIPEQDFVELPKTGSTDKKKVIECNAMELLPVGKAVPKIACVITPDATDTIKDYTFIINIKYNYEVRDKISINVIK